ncbi:Lsr2 family protein [Streptomyces sp. RP5T]|uniref:histone-like nucleoid-structuring protein Lsr2 n=1 Tax=Streptomyces sp. RP5T TaxID=2490848 RepID=UPI000F646258|nr:Lsr2 family protein [Streptomyces sp. RP5T]RRR76467.1 Lsr2 family protein [Streptomyces sp. RP5T]
MVQRTVTIYTDDLTGTEGEDIATHTFSLDGVSYEVDLNPDSYQKLLDALGPFVQVGRKAGGNSRRGGGKKTATAPDAVKVREWAQRQGIEVNSRGRVSRDVIEKYEAAH